jgi:hypothetical protein
MPHAFHALAGVAPMVINDDDAARAGAANKEQLQASQLTNKSIINCKVSFSDKMTNIQTHRFLYFQ